MTSRTGPAGGLSAEWQHLSGKNRRVLDSVFLRVHCAGNKVSPWGGRRDDGSSIQNRGKLRVCPRTNPQFARLTSGSHQTWNWVIGSPTAGQWVIWVIFHFRVTGSSFWPGVRPRVFPVFEKKYPKCKTYIWNGEMTKVIVRCLLLDWNHWMSVHVMNFYFYLWSLKILWPEKTSSHISRHLEFIIEQGH